MYRVETTQDYDQPGAVVYQGNCKATAEERAMEAIKLGATKQAILKVWVVAKEKGKSGWRTVILFKRYRVT